MNASADATMVRMGTQMTGITGMTQAQSPARRTAGNAPAVPDGNRAGVELTLNGERFRYDGDPAMPLIWYLRDVLELTGTKVGSAHSEDGSGMVLLDGRATSAMELPMAQLNGRRIITVEGLAGADGRLHPLQKAFIDEDAIGCGYCTSGWLITAMDLLLRKPNPGDDDIDRLPNRCRCGCQGRVRRAIKRAASGAGA